MAFDGKLLSGVTVLIAVVEAGTIARAAEALGLSPLRREPRPSRASSMPPRTTGSPCGCGSSRPDSIHAFSTPDCSPAASMRLVSASSKKGKSMFIAVDLPDPFTQRSNRRPPPNSSVSSPY